MGGKGKEGKRKGARDGEQLYEEAKAPGSTWLSPLSGCLCLWLMFSFLAMCQ